MQPDDLSKLSPDELHKFLCQLEERCDALIEETTADREDLYAEWVSEGLCVAERSYRSDNNRGSD